MMQKRSSAMALFLVCCVLCLVTSGCGRLLRRPQAASTTASQPVQLEAGPPRAIVVIDSTQSVTSKWDVIKQATQAFCKQAARSRDFDLAIIKLDSFPMDPKVIKNSEFTEDRWTQFKKDFETAGPEGEGTDQVTAMEKVIAAAEGDGTTVPESVILLYFSDMLVEQPKGSGNQFRDWSQFDWKKLNDAKIQCATFYIVRMANPKQSNQTRAAYRKQETVISQLRDAAKSARVNAQWINDAELEDQLAKGRFTGPEFN